MTIRPARKADAGELAELINYAGEGLPYYLWAGSAGAGEDPWDIGRERAAREHGGFSYRNGLVAEVDGLIAGALIGYPLAAEPQAADAGATPPMFVPLLELEQLAAGTWYVNAVATFPEARGLGVGSELMRAAEAAAKGEGLRGISLIVSDANLGAQKLYRRLGYEEVASRPMVKEQWKNDGRNWILMIRSL